MNTDNNIGVIIIAPLLMGCIILYPLVGSFLKGIRTQKSMEEKNE